MDNIDLFELATIILSGEASPEEYKMHEFLLNNSSYRIYFLRYEYSWHNEKKGSHNEFNYARGLELLRRKIASKESIVSAEPYREKRIGKKLIQMAASILIIIGLGYLSLAHLQNDLNTDVIISHSTQRGERLEIELADGSKIFLNSESEVKYPDKFDHKERKVFLSGEAYFEVTSDAKRPFIVHSDEIITTVLGTKFNVSTEPGKVFITLESGQVKVSRVNAEEEFFLVSGEQLSFNSETGKIIKDEVNTDIFTDWRNGVLLFNKIRFRDAIQKIENWYNVEIFCGSETLLNRNIKGRYANEELKTVLDDLEFMFDFNYEFINDSAIVINPN